MNRYSILVAALLAALAACQETAKQHVLAMTPVAGPPAHTVTNAGEVSLHSASDDATEFSILPVYTITTSNVTEFIVGTTESDGITSSFTTSTGGDGGASLGSGPVTVSPGDPRPAVSELSPSKPDSSGGATSTAPAEGTATPITKGGVSDAVAWMAVLTVGVFFALLM